MSAESVLYWHHHFADYQHLKNVSTTGTSHWTTASFVTLISRFTLSKNNFSSVRWLYLADLIISPTLNHCKITQKCQWPSSSSKFWSILTLHKKFPYLELCWSTFFRIFSHSDGIRRDNLSLFSPNARKCGKNEDQNKSEYGKLLYTV